METTLDLKMIGMYSINKVAPDKVNCTNCNNADWGDVLIEGICGRCLFQAWQAAKQGVRPTGCPDCGSLYDGKYEAHFMGCPCEKPATSG